MPTCGCHNSHWLCELGRVNVNRCRDQHCCAMPGFEMGPLRTKELGPSHSQSPATPDGVAHIHRDQNMFLGAEHVLDEHWRTCMQRALAHEKVAGPEHSNNCLDFASSKLTSFGQAGKTHFRFTCRFLARPRLARTAGVLEFSQLIGFQYGRRHQPVFPTLGWVSVCVQELCARVPLSWFCFVNRTGLSKPTVST